MTEILEPNRIHTLPGMPRDPSVQNPEKLTAFSPSFVPPPLDITDLHYTSTITSASLCLPCSPLILVRLELEGG